MGHWWRYALRLIAIIAAGAPAVMNVAGCLESFTEPVIKYGAAGVGVCADVYLLASVPAFGYLRQKRREWAFRAGLAIWLACALWTGLSSASWLAHELEAAQAPVEQKKEVQSKTESERQVDLARERETLKKQEDAALDGKKPKDVRESAEKLAAETRSRIEKLEKRNTFQAKTESAPIKSPFAGYEELVTFLLLAFSQVCWFMALEEEAGAEIASEQKPERAENSAGTETGSDAPPPPQRGRKTAGNGKRRSAGTKPGNTENVIGFPQRKRPTPEEVLAFLDTIKPDGKNPTMPEAAEHFRYSARQLQNILYGRSGSQPRQAAA